MQRGQTPGDGQRGMKMLRPCMPKLIDEETAAIFMFFGWLAASAYVIGTVVLDVCR